MNILELTPEMDFLLNRNFSIFAFFIEDLVMESEIHSHSLSGQFYKVVIQDSALNSRNGRKLSDGKGHPSGRAGPKACLSVG